VLLLPLQPPEAVQAVALVDDQVSTELAPAAIETGSAFNVSVGRVDVDRFRKSQLRAGFAGKVRIRRTSRLLTLGTNAVPI
jgi:hypothetical protein